LTCTRRACARFDHFRHVDLFLRVLIQQ
jgi:hypothetical protein